MAKLLLIQILFLIICSIAFESARGAIKNEQKFKTFIKDKVIGTFRPWALSHGKEQFAVLMLMDSDKNWDRFEFSPAVSHPEMSAVQPNVDKVVNYAAALPGLTKIPANKLKGGKKIKGHKGGASKKKVESWLHSEQRILTKYLEPMLLAYNDKKKADPEAIVLYSWIVPCITHGSCPSKGTTGCTSHIIQQLEAYATEIPVIIAYTTYGGGMKRKGGKKGKGGKKAPPGKGGTICDAVETEKELKAKHMKVLRVKYNAEEAIMEELVKLSHIMDTLE